jgi:hypothetical protein
MTLGVVLTQMRLVSVVIVELKVMIFGYADNLMDIVSDVRNLVT